MAIRTWEDPHLSRRPYLFLLSFISDTTTSDQSKDMDKGEDKQQQRNRYQPSSSQSSSVFHGVEPTKEQHAASATDPCFHNILQKVYGFPHGRSKSIAVGEKWWKGIGKYRRYRRQDRIEVFPAKLPRIMRHPIFIKTIHRQKYTGNDHSIAYQVKGDPHCCDLSQITHKISSFRHQGTASGDQGQACHKS